MIRWVWHHLVKWGWDYGYEYPYSYVSAEELRPRFSEELTGIDMNKSIRIAVLPAKGGCVVETKSFDKKNNDWINETHIIPENDDVAYRVGQIVALELLKR